MKKMIKIGKIEKLLLLPVSGGLFFIPFTLILKYTEVKNHSIILSLCSSLGMMLSLIPLLISRINMKRAMSNKNIRHKIKKENKIEIPLIYNKNNSEIKAHKFIYIFISSLADFIQTIIEATIVNYEIKVNFWLLDLLFLAIISYLLMRLKLYKHQILSMSLIIILGIFLDLFLGSLKELFNNFWYFLSKIFSEFCYSFSMVLNKYCMEFKFSRPYEVCLFIGLYTFFFYLIILIISSFISCNFNFCELEDEKTGLKYFDSFSIYTSKIDLKEFFLLIIEIINIGYINISLVLTIKYFTPYHSMIILIIGRMILTIEKLFSEIDLYNIIYIIILIFIFFGLIVYLEIIELNFCGIQKNTKDNIEKRGDIDTLLADENSSRNSSDITLSEENDINKNKIVNNGNDNSNIDDNDLNHLNNNIDNNLINETENDSSRNSSMW